MFHYYNVLVVGCNSRRCEKKQKQHIYVLKKNRTDEKNEGEGEDSGLRPRGREISTEIGNKEKHGKI